MSKIPLMTHMNQQQGGVKCDLRYDGEFGAEYIELKCGFYDFQGTYKIGRRAGTRRYQSIPYRKRKGNSAILPLNSLPDGMIVYQKYNVGKGNPASIGLVSRERLYVIIAEGRVKVTSGDFYLNINQDDFDVAFHQTWDIPKLDLDYAHKLQLLEARLANERERLRAELYRNCLVDDQLRFDFSGEDHDGPRRAVEEATEAGEA